MDTTTFRTPSAGSTPTPPSTPGTVSPQQVGEAFFRLFHRVRRVADERLGGSGMSLPRVKLVQYLQNAGPSRQSVIASCFDVAPRSVTDMVDGLERDGLVQRLEDPTDRRAKLISLTAEGCASAAGTAHERDLFFEQIFGGLDAPDRAALHGLLTRLEQSTVTAGDPTPCDAHDTTASRSES